MRESFWVAMMCLCVLVLAGGARGAAADPTDLTDDSAKLDSRPAAGGPAGTPPSSSDEDGEGVGFTAKEKPPAKPASAPAEAALKRSQQPESIEKFIEYYLDLYKRHLASDDWIARTMGVISLARIDDPRCTQRIWEVMQRDSALAVRLYAWEALHARQNRMTPEQRAAWVRTGFELGRRGALCGDMRIGLLGLIREQGPTAENKETFKRLFLNTNSLAPGDIRTLRAMGAMLAEWKSPGLVEGLIHSMSDIHAAYRAEYILRRFDKTVPPPASANAKLGSKVMWAKAQEAWQKWFDKAELKEVPDARAFTGLSDLMPRGEKITDTADPKWRQDLELGRFHLNQLDVGFAIDSTGSMGQTVRWIQRDVGKMMRAFELISREPRIGVLLYRDVGDAYVVKGIPLSGSSMALSQALKDADAKGGGDIPEAVYEALSTLVEKQQWSRLPGARKVIVLAGDAPPKEDSLEKIEKLVKDGVRNGFVFYTIKVVSHYRSILKLPNYDPKLTTFDKIASWGKGRSFRIDFAEEQSAREGAIASPPSLTAPDRVMFKEVLNAAMGQEYLDRLDPFLNVLLQYVERPTPEHRREFPPARPPSKGPGKPHPHKPPKDPQAQ